jgi:alpha,alpha-trehalase
MSDWILLYTTYDPGKEGIRETLCTLGNGYIAVRGAAEESTADEMHYPATYLAGGYNRLTSEIKGEILENEDLVNFPNFLPLAFKINGDSWLNLKDTELIVYEEALNLQEGCLTRRVQMLDEKGRQTRFIVRRFVSMDDPHVAAIEMIIHAENWDGEISILSALDGRCENAGVARYMGLNHLHIDPSEAYCLGNESIYLKVRTKQSSIQMAQAARTRIFLNGKRPRGIETGVYQEKGYIARIFKLSICRNQPLLIEKIVSIYTSKDRAISECGLEARNAIGRLGTFEELFEHHKMAWSHIWRRFDIEITCEDEEEDIVRLLRLHIFHILQTCSLHSRGLDVGVPPRGWHGEAYRGHILWDELFIFSTLNLRFPELTRSLLLYRYRRLSVARRAARELGLRGAMFPWQSGSDGREESQLIHLNPKSGRWIPDNSRLQRHVNSAIAYNVWQYYEATGDLEFLSFYGAEIILEIARFWVSLASYHRETDRYHIRGVMGPDEYHERYPDSEKPGLDNNTYTNVMASWVLGRALDTLSVLPKDRRLELEEVLELSGAETHLWEVVRKKLFIPFHEGIISQFEGYEALKDLDWEGYKKKYGNIQRLDRILEAEGDDVNAYKVSKQADVLMLFYLFSFEELKGLFQEMGYSLTVEMIQNTIDYYLARTSHGSSLSEVIHSWVLSRSARETSWRLFREALKGDFIDIQGGTTPEGIHLGAMAGTVDLIQRCYSGIEFRGNILRFNPRLPDELKAMKIIIRYRGHSLSIQITQKKLTIISERASAKPIQIAYEQELYSLKEGEIKEFKLAS